ncbi:MAG TPA: hypothetical protein ENI23_09510 [bacterium]|nr:hypothetical protein [bacterium]
MNYEFKDVIHALVAKAKQDEFAKKPIKTLGEVILLLKSQPPFNIIELDFTTDNPSDLISYRGYYTDLALDYDDDVIGTNVRQLLKMFEEADGRTYEGYKGGDFTMHRKTLVWVAPYGSCGRMLVDVQSKKNITTIITQENDKEDKNKQ